MRAKVSKFCYLEENRSIIMNNKKSLGDRHIQDSQSAFYQVNYMKQKKISRDIANLKQPWKSGNFSIESECQKAWFFS